MAVTDGIIEAKSPAGEQFGQDRLVPCCATVAIARQPK